MESPNWARGCHKERFKENFWEGTKRKAKILMEEELV